MQIKAIYESEFLERVASQFSDADTDRLRKLFNPEGADPGKELVFGDRKLSQDDALGKFSVAKNKQRNS